MNSIKMVPAYRSISSLERCGGMVGGERRLRRAQDSPILALTAFRTNEQMNAWILNGMSEGSKMIPEKKKDFQQSVNKRIRRQSKKQV